MENHTQVCFSKDLLQFHIIVLHNNIPRIALVDTGACHLYINESLISKKEELKEPYTVTGFCDSKTIRYKTLETIRFNKSLELELEFHIDCYEDILIGINILDQLNFKIDRYNLELNGQKIYRIRLHKSEIKECLEKI